MSRPVRPFEFVNGFHDTANAVANHAVNQFLAALPALGQGLGRERGGRHAASPSEAHGTPRGRGVIGAAERSGRRGLRSGTSAEGSLDGAVPRIPGEGETVAIERLKNGTVLVK